VPHPLTTLALFDGDEILCVVGFFNYDKISVEGAIASDRPWGDRRFIRKVFHYVFNELGCRRFYVRVDASNTQAHEMDLRLGFRHEGTLREAAQDGGDVHVLAMLKSEYLESKWHGKESAKSAGNA